MIPSKLILVGFLIILGGMAIVALGIISSAESEIEGGGAVVIGPIPIAFGTSKSLA